MDRGRITFAWKRWSGWHTKARQWPVRQNGPCLAVDLPDQSAISFAIPRWPRILVAPARVDPGVAWVSAAGWVWLVTSQFRQRLTISASREVKRRGQPRRVAADVMGVPQAPHPAPPRPTESRTGAHSTSARSGRRKCGWCPRGRGSTQGKPPFSSLPRVLRHDGGLAGSLGGRRVGISPG